MIDDRFRFRGGEASARKSRSRLESGDLRRDTCESQCDGTGTNQEYGERKYDQER